MYTIKSEEVSNPVCICPEGFYGLYCETQLYTKCLVNITDPPVYDTVNQCQVKREDTLNYVFSIPGFDPCFYFDFEKTYTLEFMLNCRVLNHRGLVEMSDTGVGYEYEDVLEVTED